MATPDAAVPLPLVTEQVCAGPVGWARTVTLYSYIIGLTNGDGGFELGGGIGPGDRKIIGTIVLQNQACATKTANGNSYRHGAVGEAKTETL